MPSRRGGRGLISTLLYNGRIHHYCILLFRLLPQWMFPKVTLIRVNYLALCSSLRSFNQQQICSCVFLEQMLKTKEVMLTLTD